MGAAAVRMYSCGAGPHLHSRGPQQMLLLPGVYTGLLQVRPEHLLHHHRVPGQEIDCCIPQHRHRLVLRIEFTVNDRGARDMAIEELPVVTTAAASCTAGAGADVCNSASWACHDKHG